MTTNNGNPPPLEPYLINAVLDYCRDNGATPYVMVAVDDACSVPRAVPVVEAAAAIALFDSYLCANL